MRFFPTKTLMRQYFVPIARLSLALIYIWFGILKILDPSPAESLVHNLQNATIPHIPFNFFYVAFSYFEVILGILFLFPKLTKIACLLLLFHLFTTVLPLIALPHTTWSNYLTPTLIGQYIIKNVAILVVAWGIYAHE